MPPKVRTPRFRARPSREITSPCFSRLIVLSRVIVSLPRLHRIKSLAGHLRHRILFREHSSASYVTLAFSRRGL